MSEGKLKALGQVPILPDDRFKFSGIAKWCGEDVASKKNAWHGVDTESFVDGVRTKELVLRKETK